MQYLNTLSLHSYINVTDQVSHPYKTTGKITVLYSTLQNITNKYNFVLLNTLHKNNMMRNKRHDLVSDPAAHEQVMTADR